jgi:hypothetical protein
MNYYGPPSLGGWGCAVPAKSTSTLRDGVTVEDESEGVRDDSDEAEDGDRCQRLL